MSRCDECSGNDAPRAMSYNVAECDTRIVPINQKAYLPECDCDFTIAERSNKPGEYIFSIDGCSAKLDIKKGVKSNETITHLNSDGQGSIVYTNEQETKEKVHIKDLLPFANIEDLGNVDDQLDDGCAFFFKNKGSDSWSTWKTETHILQPSDSKPVGIMVFTEKGCPRYMPAPTSGLATLVARDGKVEWSVLDLPEGADKNSFNPAWGNTNHTNAADNQGTPDRKNGIFTHNPQEDKCHDTTFK